MAGVKGRSGGARKGAGNFASEEKTTVTFRVSAEAMRIIRENKYKPQPEVNDLLKTIARKIELGVKK